jgi:hypothetical protein
VVSSGVQRVDWPKPRAAHTARGSIQ